MSTSTTTSAGAGTVTDYDVPEINFDSGVLTQDLLRGHFAFLGKTIRDQMQILGAGRYGVVDPIDPATAGSDPNTRPFQIASDSTSDTTLYVVTAGVCVTQNYDIAAVESRTQVRLASQTKGVMNLVCVRYQVVDSGIKSVTSTNHIASAGTIGKVDVVCVTEAAYLALGTSDRNRIVVVAGIYIDAVSGAQEIVYSDSTRAWLRPWFVFVDSQHRAQMGSGNATTSNPHGTSIADLGIGEHKTFDLLTSSGMICSRDRSIKGVPGTYCKDVFTPSQVSYDTDGSITKSSFFGGSNNALYVRLSAVPNTVSGARDADGYPVPCDWIRGTNVVVLYIRNKPTASISISYIKTNSLAVVSATPTSVSVSGIDANDIVISNGVAVASLLQGSVSFRRFGNIPRSFSVLCTDTGYLIPDPNVIAPALNIITYAGENLLTGTWTPRSRSRVGIGAHDLGAASTMTVTVRVVGTDAFTGAVVTENIKLTQAQYEDAAYPPSAREYDNQVTYSETVFSGVDNITIIPSGTVDVSRTGTLTVYSKMDAAGHRYASVCSGFWNGREVADVIDSRRVLTSIRDGWFGETDITATAEVLVAANEVVVGTALANAQDYKRVGLLFAEDFREPRYLDADTTLWDGTVPANQLIPVAVENSDRYRGVYRSRLMPIRKYDTELCGFIVFLHTDDVSEIASPGAVRVLLRNEGTAAGTYAEATLVQMRGDLSGRVFIGYTNANYRAAGVVVSGKCRAVSVYFSNAQSVDTSYIVTVTPKSASAL